MTAKMQGRVHPHLWVDEWVVVRDDLHIGVIHGSTHDLQENWQGFWVPQPADCMPATHQVHSCTQKGLRLIVILTRRPMRPKPLIPSCRSGAEEG
jgi:hypothetical protein